MAQEATLVVLFLVFVGAIFIHYMLTNIEPFKEKKGSRKNRLGKKGSGKNSKGMKGSGKKRSGKNSRGMKGSGKKRSGKNRSGKNRSGKNRSGKNRSGKKRSGKNSRGMKRPGKNCPGNNRASGPQGMKFSDVVGSLLSPSLPDSRDLKDKLHAAVDYTVDNASLESSTRPSPRIPRNGNMPSGVCASSDRSSASNAMPYNIDMNDYVKKDSIPCYGCNI